jgi:hypothetical protein
LLERPKTVVAPLATTAEGQSVLELTKRGRDDVVACTFSRIEKASAVNALIDVGHTAIVCPMMGKRQISLTQQPPVFQRFDVQPPRRGAGPRFLVAARRHEVLFREGVAENGTRNVTSILTASRRARNEKQGILPDLWSVVRRPSSVVRCQLLVSWLGPLGKLYSQRQIGFLGFVMLRVPAIC